MLLACSQLATATTLPKLALQGSDGAKHNIQDHVGQGRWTALIVWGPKCPACLEEMPEIQTLYDERDSTNIDVVGLVLDYPSFAYPDIKQVQLYEEDNFISFPSLLISSNIYNEFNIGRLQGTPTIILVNPKGDVSAVQLGAVPTQLIKDYIKKQGSVATTK